MECAQLSLSEFSMAKSENWKYEECFEIFKNLENIIRKLSQNNIYYCDYKFQNIVFDKKSNLKLIDLGTIVFQIQDYGKFGLTKDYSILTKLSKENKVDDIKRKNIIKLLIN